MSYVSQVPNDLLTLDVNAWVIDTNSQHVLNDFFSDVRETTGDISATNQGGNGGVAEPGETLTVPTATGDLSGTYVGPATFSTANVTVGIPTVANINVKLNDIDGHLMRADNGTAYFISESPLDDDRLGATISLQLLGQNIQLVDVPLSEANERVAARLDEIGNQLGTIGGAPFRIAATTVRNGADITQTVIDRATVNVAVGDGTLPVICFVAGTLIKTASGDVPIEELREGMLVQTLDHGLQPIRWIGSRKINALTLLTQTRLRPIRIKAGALGAGRPAQDLLVSPQHRILLRSKIALKMFGTAEILVAAKQLLNLQGVDIATDMAEVEYFHFLFDRHEVVISNGTETESLFTGPEALKAVGPEAREEIIGIFPELLCHDYNPMPVRLITSGRKSRKMVMRHCQNEAVLVS